MANSDMPSIPSGIPDTFPFSDGAPLFPLYGFDNIEDETADENYTKQMMSKELLRIQAEVEEVCDKLEYEGSCMYHACPDKMYLQMLSSRIYEQVADIPFKASPLEINAISPPCRGRNCPPPPPCYGRHCPPPRRNYRDDGKPDWLKHLIDFMLFQEINHRRRRYRSRHSY